MSSSHTLVSHYWLDSAISPPLITSIGRRLLILKTCDLLVCVACLLSLFFLLLLLHAFYDGVFVRLVPLQWCRCLSSTVVFLCSSFMWICLLIPVSVPAWGNRANESMLFGGFGGLTVASRQTWFTVQCSLCILNLFLLV